MAMSVEFQSFIDEVIDRNDIVDVVSMYAKLKRSGRTYRGLCPIHNDRKNPSLSVDPQARLFKCFGCGAGGTVIQFIMAKENLDFMEAVKLLADRAGIPVPERQSPSAQREAVLRRDKKERMLKMHKEAARYFYKCLCDKENEEALRYLRKRNLSNETIKHFGVGYAPRQSGLYKYLREKDFSFAEAEEASLIYKGKNGYFDKFRGRIMFPVFDLRGNVIAFGGRTIFDDKAKYMNSNGSLIYNKSQTLFAFNFAKDSPEDEFLLMEGNVDVISLHQAGFCNAIAPMGTAFTSEQARLIKRYKNKVVLCYDSDAAGQKAVYAAGKILMDEGVAVRVMTVTGAKDPDEFVNKYGAERFLELIASAENFIEYKIRKTLEKYNLDDIDQKIEFVMAASEILADIKDAVKAELYINDIAAKVGIEAEKFKAQIKNIKSAPNGSAEASVMRSELKNIETRRGGRAKTPEERRIYEAEKLFLNLICDKKIYLSQKDGISPDDMTEDLHKRMCEKLYSLHERGESFEATRFIANFPDEESGAAAEILTDDRNVENRAAAAEQAARVIKEGLQKRRASRLSKDDDEGLLEYFRELKAKKQ